LLLPNGKGNKQSKFEQILVAYQPQRQQGI